MPRGFPIPREDPDAQGEVATSGYRIGFGEDSHRLEPGESLRLGGVDIPHDKRLVGHSDADVLLHAVTDALLGAVGLPDIGQLFPNTDEANRDRDSSEMLALAAGHLADAGYAIVNLDCVVAAQKPALAPHQAAIRQRLADILDVAPAEVGLKAKTGEGVGSVGREEAIQARCVVLVSRIRD